MLFQNKKALKWLLIAMVVFIFSNVTYGKPEPASIINDFKLAEPLEVGKPLKMIIEIESMPFSSGSLKILMLPEGLTFDEAGTGPAKEIVIWTGSNDSNSAMFKKTIEYTIAPLPPGIYEFKAIFETILNSGSKSGYIQPFFVVVTTDKILFSKVSNRSIRDYEIYEELKKRGLSEASEEEIRKLAPDLIEKWDEIYHEKDKGPIREKTPKEKTLIFLPLPGPPENIKK